MNEKDKNRHRLIENAANYWLSLDTTDDPMKTGVTYEVEDLHIYPPRLDIKVGFKFSGQDREISFNRGRAMFESKEFTNGVWQTRNEWNDDDFERLFSREALKEKKQ